MFFYDTQRTPALAKIGDFSKKWQHLRNGYITLGENDIPASFFMLINPRRNCILCGLPVLFRHFSCVPLQCLPPHTITRFDSKFRSRFTQTHHLTCLGRRRNGTAQISGQTNNTFHHLRVAFQQSSPAIIGVVFHADSDIMS